MPCSSFPWTRSESRTTAPLPPPRDEVPQPAELELRVHPPLDDVKREVVSAAQAPHAKHEQTRRAPAPVLDEQDAGGEKADEEKLPGLQPHGFGALEVAHGLGW